MKNSLYFISKRAFDVVFALIVLIVLSPIYLLTAIIIKFSSPGPVFYKAFRIGENGQPFICYKFRSMVADSGKVALTTLENDERIFPFGRFIRKAKIDELPQFFNVLIGNMSVVGPRPEDKENSDFIYTGRYRNILNIKPGLTSPASLYDYTHGEKYSSEEEYKSYFLPQKLELELYYVENRSAIYDIRLIFRTIKIVFLSMLGKRKFKKPVEVVYIMPQLEKQESLATKI